MTSNQPFDDELTSPEDFDDALYNLLHAALQNGIDPRGAWEYRTDGTSTDWEVMVVELQSKETTD